MNATRPLRVLEVAPRYFPDLGGTESHVHEVTTRMLRTGEVDVTVLATDRSGRLPRAERTVEGFDVVRRRAYPSSRDYYIAPGIAGVVARGEWDLVHFQGVHTFVPILGMLAARAAGVPYVLTFHTGGHSSAVRTAHRSRQWRALTPLLRRARRLIAVSRFERDLFEGVTGIERSRFVVIRNGGALPAPDRGAQPVPGRILSSGRLERYKGHHRVVEALPSIVEKEPAAHLVVLGAGPYESELRSLAAARGVADRVTIRQIDPRDRAGMATELASAQVLAALSDYEAHPVAVMEALALGVPAVGFDVAGVGDLVDDGFVHGIAPDASSGRIADRLLDVLRAGRGAAADPGRLPTWQTCTDALLDVYRESVDPARQLR